ncbi:MAG: META domain-containing protein [Pseudomonadota bacterium]
MRFLTATLLILGACADETVSGYADPDASYVLATIDGTVFSPRATIAFPTPGEALGDAPCNRWSARQSAPYPWFDLGPIAATRRARTDLAEERIFLSALAEMTLAEVQGPVLILSNDTGRELVFRADP